MTVVVVEIVIVRVILTVITATVIVIVTATIIIFLNNMIMSVCLYFRHMYVTLTMETIIMSI